MLCSCSIAALLVGQAEQESSVLNSRVPKHGGDEGALCKERGRRQMKAHTVNAKATCALIILIAIVQANQETTQKS